MENPLEENMKMEGGYIEGFVGILFTALICLQCSNNALGHCIL